MAGQQLQVWSKARAALLLAAAGACALAAAPARGADPDDFTTEFTYDWSSDGSVRPGWDVPGRLYAPADDGQNHPLVVFLHGIGERGSDNTQQINRNIDALLDAAGEHHFFLYAPQSNGGWWSEFPHVLQMVAKASNRYHVDTSRLYVTGLSAGGAGTLGAAASYHDLFAGFVPLSAAATINDAQAPGLVGEPMWFYHARNDGTVSVSSSRNSVNHIREADGLPGMTFPLNNTVANPNFNDGSPYYSDGSTFYAHHNLRYSEYQTGGHSNATWARAYNEPQLYDWLMDQTNPIAALGEGRSILVDVNGDWDNDDAVDARGRHWNGAGGYLANKTREVATAFARDTTGRRTAVSMSVSGLFDAAQGSTPDGITAVAEFAGHDYWLVGNYNNNPQPPGELTFTGLTPGGEYLLELFASISGTDGARGHLGLYEAAGVSVIFDASNNLDTFITLDGLFADTVGELTLAVSPAAGSRFAVLNAVRLTFIPEPRTAALVLLGLGAAAMPVRGRAA